MKRIHLFLFLFLLLSSCKFNLDNPDLGPDSLTISLDKTAYHIDETVLITVQNGSNEDLFLGNCGMNPGFDILKLNNSQWEIPYDLTCEGIGSPFEIKTGEVLIKSVHIPIFRNQLEKVEGKYKLRLWLYKKDISGNQNYLPDSLRLTDAFDLVE